MGGLGNGILHLKFSHAATRGIPFDQIYLVPKAQKDAFRRVFPAYLRTSINGAVWANIRLAEINEVSGEQHGRHVTEAVPATGAVTFGSVLPPTADLQRYYDVVVPVILVSKTSTIPSTLSARHRRRAKAPTNAAPPDTNAAPPSWEATLGYLVTSGWYSSRAAGRMNPLNRRLALNTTLVVVGEELTPPCIACPKMLEMLGGMCRLGDKECLTGIGLVSRPTYLARMESVESGEVDLSILSEDP